MSPSVIAEQIATNRIRLSISPSPGFAKFRMSSKTVAALQQDIFKGRAPMNDLVELATTLSSEYVVDTQLDEGNIVLYLADGSNWESVRDSVIEAIAKYLQCSGDMQVKYIPRRIS